MKNYFTRIASVLSLLVLTHGAYASELFIKINRVGQHSVLVNDQYQTNNSNIYRFFELNPGLVTLKISDANTGNLVYDGSISIGNDERLVTEMNANGSIVVLATQKVTYANWYTQNGTTTAPSNPTPPTPPAPPVPSGPVAVDDAKLQEMIAIIDREMTDNGKVSKAKSITKKHFFTSAQIVKVCKLLTFDSYKLEYAKFAYDYCVDKSNYYLVSDAFQFSSYSKELDDYIDKKN